MIKRLSSLQLNTFFKKLHWKELIAVLFILVAIYFFREQRGELRQLVPSVHKADDGWMLAGLLLTVIYIGLQTALYVYSFKTVNSRIKWVHAIELFVKRNLVSVFLPAGGVSSLAYLPRSIRKAQIHKQQVHQASGIYGFIGIFSVFVVAIPLFIYLAIEHSQFSGSGWALFVIFLLLAAVVVLMNAIRKKNRVYESIAKRWPSFKEKLDAFFAFDFSAKAFVTATVVSVLIEVAGIAHLYIAMLASHVVPSFEAAVVGYIIATLFLIVSPFLRGIGAIELSLTVILQQYGFTTLQALEITLLFRLFEFWLPLLAGALSFIFKGKNLLLRLLPPVMIFFLGVVNIFSVLTPPIVSRLKLLREFVPVSSINASNLFIILTGVTLVVTATFLFRGLRNAWILALTLSLLSCIGNITKALDYEEALLSLIVSIILVATSKQYNVKSNQRLMNIGLITVVACFGVVLIFGTIAFYYSHPRHFGVNLNWQQALKHAFNTFVLITNQDLTPLTPFANDMMLFIRVLGFGAWLFFIYTLIHPYIYKNTPTEEVIERANYYLTQYGDSALDYFKTAEDKLLYVSEKPEGFIAYRIANDFAVVLEEPVCAEKDKIAMLIEFERSCSKMGLKTAFYRVDEESLYHFETLKKKKLLIGQEAVLDIKTFTLEGKDKKSLRNGLNSLSKKGYKVKRHIAPLQGSLVQALQQVSDEWLKVFEMEETVFSQGMFNRQQIKENDVITLEDAEGRIVAFLNIIPDFNPEECTYDLIRKTQDAPGGSMDALIIELIQYAKEKDYNYLNLGLVPLSGIEDPESTAEEVVKFAYEKIKRFKTYHGLRDFKEKYASQWVNKYLMYKNDYDLLQLPVALQKVMQPPQKNRA